MLGSGQIGHKGYPSASLTRSLIYLLVLPPRLSRLVTMAQFDSEGV